MSTRNAIPWLQDSAGTDDTSLALKMSWDTNLALGFRDEAWFANNTLDFVAKKAVNSGKSWQFLRFGDIPDAAAFTPGTERTGDSFVADEGTITPDGYLSVSHFIRRDQLHMSHFEVMAALGKAQGSRLGRLFSRQIGSMLCQAGRVAAVTKQSLNIHNGANRVTRTGGTTSGGAAVLTTPYPVSATGAANLVADLRQLFLLMAQDNLPTNRLGVVIRKDMMHVLRFDTTNTLFSTDFVNMNNVQAPDAVKEVAGFKILAQLNPTSLGGPIPDQNLVAEQFSKYNVNGLPAASNGTPVAIGMAFGTGHYGVGCAVFQDVELYGEADMNRKGFQMYADMFMGCGIMHPDVVGSVEVIT